METMVRKKRKPMSEINVVPYIDVMLVLLIVFMVTAPMLNQGIEVDLPQANNEPLNLNENLEIESEGLLIERFGALDSVKVNADYNAKTTEISKNI